MNCTLRPVDRDFHARYDLRCLWISCTAPTGEASHCEWVRAPAWRCVHTVCRAKWRRQRLLGRAAPPFRVRMTSSCDKSRSSQGASSLRLSAITLRLSSLFDAPASSISRVIPFALFHYCVLLCEAFDLSIVVPASRTTVPVRPNPGSRIRGTRCSWLAFLPSYVFMLPYQTRSGSATYWKGAGELRPKIVGGQSMCAPPPKGTELGISSAGISARKVLR